MVKLIDKHHDRLFQLCERFRVRKLEGFGSAATGDRFGNASDMDFLVEFQELEPNAYVPAYFGLLEELEQLFGRRVDLVMPEAIKNRYFLRGITASRTTIYAA